MKSKISMALILLGGLRMTYAFEGQALAFFIGAIMVFVGFHLVNERKNSLLAIIMGLVVGVLGFGGGLAEIIDWGEFDVECAQWLHIIGGFVVAYLAFARYCSKEVPIAENDRALYQILCRRLEIPQDRLPLCFMARYDDTYIGIGSDDNIYSYYNYNGRRGVKKIPISNIVKYEKFTVDGNVRVFVKIYERGGSTYEYGFTMGEHIAFMDCLDYLMNNPCDTNGPIDNIFERFDTACRISGIDPEIYNLQNI